MSLFSIFSALLILAGGEIKSANSTYDEEWYPIQIQLMSVDNNRIHKNWVVLAPKYLIRHATEKLGYFENPSEENPMYSDEMDYVEQIPWYLRRAWNLRPHTEMGPGAFKSDIINFPPQTLGNRLKKLLEMQTKQQEEGKDVNVVGDEERLNKK